MRILVDEKHLKAFLTSQCFQEPPPEVVELVRDYAQLILDEIPEERSFIGTVSCSDENGWAAWFEPNGDFSEEMFEYRSTGFETEESAIQALVQMACKDIKWAERLRRARDAEAA